MKVIIVALNAKYVHSNLAVHCIKAYVDKNSKYSGDIEVKEYTINQDLDSIIQSIYMQNADIIAFSCYIWNIKEVLSISNELKKLKPSLNIWLGGPEVSYHSERLLKNYTFIELIINGEGEATFSELLCKFEAKSQTLNDIKGITARDQHGNIITTDSRPCIHMDTIPFIYDDFDQFKNKILYYESSRGCPFSCSYCLSSIDKTVRYRSIELVKSELQIFLDNNVPQVKFIDRTFNCKKDRALELWEYINSHDNGVTNFHFEIAADLIGKDEIALFSKMRPGLIQLEIGLQTTNENTVREIKRTMDINVLKENMLSIRKNNNIHQHLDLIAGLPYENYESFQKSFCDAFSMKPHQLQLGFLKVLKGSYMESMKEQYGLIYHDEQPYEVMSTNWITYEEIIELKRVEEMVEVYYNSGQFKNSVSYLLNYFNNPFQFFRELGNYYEQKNIINIGFKREARYEVLRSFAAQKVKKIDILDDLLVVDYYLRENARKRPAFSEEEKIENDRYQNFFKNGGTKDFSIVNVLNITKYDSKVAARKMHIEPVSYESYKHIISISNDENAIPFANTIFCLFDYDSRNAMTYDARVFYLTEI